MAARYRDLELDVEINTTQLDILLAMDDIIEDKGNCIISSKELARKINKTPDCVKRNIKKLNNIGFINIRPRYLYNGGRAENEYTLSTEAELLVCNFHIITSM